MALFSYEIMDKSGNRSEGVLEAKDKFALYHSIKKDGVTIISTKEVKKEKRLSFSAALPFFTGVSAHDKIIFARNLAKMIQAGLPMTKGLAIMEKEASGQFKKILNNLNQSVSKGDTLSSAMKKYTNVFSTLFVSMVRSGEESGNLATALENVALQLEKTYQLNRKIRGALMYPAVILCLMIAIGILMMVYMVPTLTATFVGLGIKLPLSTRIIIFVSNFLKGHFLVFIAGVVAFIFAFALIRRTKGFKRMTDSLFLHIPIIKEMTKQVNSARTARTLSSLIGAGVDIVVAIGVTKDVLQNSYYKEVLEEVETTIQKGQTISTIFSAHENLFPPFVGEMTSVGEETGKIGEMLHSVALFYEDEIDQKTKDMSSVIEPFLMIAIGVAVGFFAISLISPIYSIGDNIN